jgi:hypothetical protein
MNTYIHIYKERDGWKNTGKEEEDRVKEKSFNSAVQYCK